MEINTQQLEALSGLKDATTQPQRRSESQTQGFDSILSRQLGAVPAEASLPGVSPNALYNPLLIEETEAATAASSDELLMQAAFTQASDTLDLWEMYGQVLGGGNQETSLRDAYAILDGIDANLAAMSQNRGRNPLFDSMLNELEALAATERFKFNRGDYLA